MLVLLPPSETKRGGGTEKKLHLSALSFPELRSARSALISQLRALAADAQASIRALKLGPQQQHEILRNRLLTRSATMPVLERYDGVLFNALDAASFTACQAVFAAENLCVHSALFGLVRAADNIPAYRLSHNSRLPGLSLKKYWAEPIAAALQGVTGLILDFRSEAYRALGPLTERPNSYFLRVVSVNAAGVQRTLTHLNKATKGEFARAIVAAGHAFDAVEELLSWAGNAGYDLQLSSTHPTDLILTI